MENTSKQVTSQESIDSAAGKMKIVINEQKLQSLIYGMHNYCQIVYSKLSQDTLFRPQIIPILLRMSQTHQDEGFLLLLTYFQRYQQQSVDLIYKQIINMNVCNKYFALIVMLVLSIKPNQCENFLDQIQLFSESEQAEVLQYVLDIILILADHGQLNQLTSLNKLGGLLLHHLKQSNERLVSKGILSTLSLLSDKSTRYVICKNNVLRNLAATLFRKKNPYKIEICTVLNQLFGDPNANVEFQVVAQQLLHFFAYSNQPELFMKICQTFTTIAEIRSLNFVKIFCHLSLFKTAGAKLFSIQESQQVALLEMIATFLQRLDSDQTDELFVKCLNVLDKVPGLIQLFEDLQHSKNNILAELATFLVDQIYWNGDDELQEQGEDKAE